MKYKLAIAGKIANDLKESSISWKVAALFIPIAFCSYLFHESGHWLLGELAGNDMVLSLNCSAPKSGTFLSTSDALLSAIGGPLFTILQALAFLIVILITRSVYAYTVTFFAGFSRFFSLIFGGISLQDEARIAALLNINTYFIVAAVPAILFLILWHGTRIMKMNTKAVGYFTVLGVIAELVVILIAQ